MRTIVPTFQELSGHGELHTSGQPPVGVLYHIFFLALPRPPPFEHTDSVGTNKIATGHMTPLRELDRPLDQTAEYGLVLANGQQVSVNLEPNSMEQFALYTFHCATSDLV